MSEINSKSEMRRLDIMKTGEIEDLRKINKLYRNALEKIKREESNSQRPGGNPSNSFLIAEKALKEN